MSTEELIHLEEYNINWPEKFAREKKLIEETLDSWITGGIEHVGSTAIPGMIAKPIIDIMVGIKNLEEAKACIPLLEKIGYLYYPYKPDRMHWFCKPSVTRREFHLYLMEPWHSEVAAEKELWEARIAFRDYLRQYPKVAAEYVALKTELATKYRSDREAYAEGKKNFIKSVANKALEQK